MTEVSGNVNHWICSQCKSEIIDTMDRMPYIYNGPERKCFLCHSGTLLLKAMGFEKEEIKEMWAKNEKINNLNKKLDEYKQLVKDQEPFNKYIQEISETKHLGMRYTDIAVDIINELKETIDDMRSESKRLDKE